MGENVLIIEDSDVKYKAVFDVIVGAAPAANVTRASTVIEAESQIERIYWDLVILDISMDIAPSALGPRSRGQANIGGLGVAQRMFLLEREAPTIILTAFDSFSAPTIGHGDTEIVGFEEIRRRAKEFLPASLLGCLQYSSSTWKEEMRSMTKSALGL